jgi:hypothetical protein
VGHNVIASWEVEEQGPLALILTSLVTFLNKQLKDRDLIFGLARTKGKLTITIYEVERIEPE